jgi:hypothetical protein
MHTLADMFSGPISDDFKHVLAIGGAFTVAILAILTGFIRRLVSTRAREATKRELAAYVAEGSMKPEDAERIINAGGPRWGRCG